jgi:hypothetical protein
MMTLKIASLFLFMVHHSSFIVVFSDYFLRNRTEQA